MARRKLQAEAVVAILKERFGANPGAAAWVVLGDLNDYLPSSGLEPLLGQPWLENVVERIPDPDERWTHYFDDDEDYQQLDYLLLSKALADANPTRSLASSGSVCRAVRSATPARASTASVRTGRKPLTTAPLRSKWTCEAGLPNVTPRGARESVNLSRLVTMQLLPGSLPRFAPSSTSGPPSLLGTPERLGPEQLVLSIVNVTIDTNVPRDATLARTRQFAPSFSSELCRGDREDRCPVAARVDSDRLGS